MSSPCLLLADLQAYLLSCVGEGGRPEPGHQQSPGLQVG